MLTSRSGGNFPFVNVTIIPPKILEPEKRDNILKKGISNDQKIIYPHIQG